MAKLASKVYGDALFDLAVEEDRCSQYLEEALFLQKVLKENPDVAAFVKNPQISREEKAAFMESCFKGQVSDELIGLLNVTITKGRFRELDSIFKYFISRIQEYEKIGKAEVVSPLALSEAQKSAVENKLLATTRYEKMEMVYRIDPSLIGGMVIRIGDRVVDTSIRQRLDGLKNDLLQISLA